MGAWSTSLTDPLWRSALATIPLAVIAACACRWLPLRPATRHAVWLGVMVFALVGSVAAPLRTTDRCPPGAAANGDVSLSAAAVSAGDAGERQADAGCDWTDSTEERAPDEALPPLPDAVAKAGEKNIEKARNNSAVQTEVVDEHSCRSAEQPCKTAAAPADRSPPTPPRTVDPTEPPSPALLQTANGSAGRPSTFISEFQECSVPTAETPRAEACATEGAATLVIETSLESTCDVADERIEAGAARVAGVDVVPLQTPVHVSMRRLVPDEQHSHRPVSVGDVAAVGTASGAQPPVSAMQPLRHWIEGLAGVRDAFGRLPALPAWLWGLGAAALVLAGLARWLRFSRLVSQGAPGPGSLRRIVAETARELELRAVPQAIVVNAPVSPMIWCGGMRPVLVMPRRLWGELDDIGRRVVVCHELAHLRRRDHWVCWLEALTGILYWWHPLLWWVRARLRDEAEHCCDAWVTWLYPTGRRAYAEALLAAQQFTRTESRTSSTPVHSIGVVSGRTKRLARRLTMVMTQRTKPKHSGLSIVLVAMMAGIGWAAMPAQSCPPEEKERTPACAPAPATPAPPAPPAQPAPIQQFLYAPAPAPAVASVSIPVATSVMTAAPTAVVAGSAAPQARGAGQRRSSVEDRLARLEEKLAHLSEQLAHLTGHGPAAHGHAAAGGHSRIASGEVAEAHRRVQEELARAGMHARSAAGETGAKMERTYTLPAGKMAALTQLMVRQDVPLLVRPGGEDKITVIGTEHEQAAFRAFLDIIHPEGRGKGASSAADQERRAAAEYYARTGRLELAERYAQLGQYAAQYAAIARLQGDAKAAAEMGRAARQWPRMAELQRRIQELRSRWESLNVEGSQIEAMADQLDAQADDLREKAEELRERADELRMRAEEMKNKKESKELRGSADELNEKARDMEAKADELGHKVEELVAMATQKENEAEQIEAELEASLEASLESEEEEENEIAVEADEEPEYEEEEEENEE